MLSLQYRILKSTSESIYKTIHLDIEKKSYGYQRGEGREEDKLGVQDANYCM